MEEAVALEGKVLSDMSLEEKDVYWDRAKQELNRKKT
jgi:uncharacterized protein YabN with tetrapyrrole methylase and pyrophosphatase domain